MTDAATSVAAAAYQAFQSASAETIPTLSKEFSELVAAASDTAVQPHVRVYAVNMIGQHGSKFDKSAVKAALEAIIALLGEEDETKVPQKLTVAAIDAFVSMCKATDDFVRVATDLCVIIILNKDGFPKAAIEAAEAGLKSLTNASVVGVVKKYLHLISDEREKDDEEQLARERAFSINHLQRILNDKSFVEQWTEESQTSIHSYLASVIPTATRYELNVLLKAFTKLSSLGDGTFFVDKLLKAKLEPARLFDALAVVAPHVPRTITHDAIAEKLLSLVSSSNAAATPSLAPAPAPKKGGKKAAAAAAVETATAAAATASSSGSIDLATDVNAAVAFTLAARTASLEMANKVTDALFEALDKAIPSSSTAANTNEESDTATDSAVDAAAAYLPENLSAVEAILIALTSAAVKNHVYATEKLSAHETLVERLTKTYEALSTYKKFVTFAAKKQILDGTPTDEEKRAHNLSLAVLNNLIALIGPLTTKHLPSSTIVPSWEKAPATLHVAAVRAAGKKTLRDLLPGGDAVIPTREKAALAAVESRDTLLNGPLAAKKSRVETTNSHQNKGRHSNGHGSNNNNNKGNRSASTSGNRNHKGGRRF